MYWSTITGSINIMVINIIEFNHSNDKNEFLYMIILMIILAVSGFELAHKDLKNHKDDHKFLRGEVIFFYGTSLALTIAGIVWLYTLKSYKSPFGWLIMIPIVLIEAGVSLAYIYRHRIKDWYKNWKDNRYK